jgi:hypothetical protein
MSYEDVEALFGKRVKITNPKGVIRTGRVIGYDYQPPKQREGDWVVIQPDDEFGSDVGLLETVQRVKE